VELIPSLFIQSAKGLSLQTPLENKQRKSITRKTQVELKHQMKKQITTKHKLISRYMQEINILCWLTRLP